MKISRTALVLLASIGVSALAGRLSSAELSLESVDDTVAECEEIGVRVVLRDVEAGTSLSGYQLYLTYFAAAVTPVRFEGSSLAATIFTAGVEPFGRGFAACDDWSDGLALDVAAVGGTIFPDSEEGSVEELAIDGELEIGVVYFAVSAPIFGATSVQFAASDQSCREFFDETTSVFDLEGVKIDLTLGGPISVTIQSGGDAVEELSCEFAGSGEVELAWSLPDGSSYESIRVDRDGELVAELDGDAKTFTDTDPGSGVTLTYAVTPILSGGVSGCAATCSVDSPGVPFKRGDVNFDGRFNSTDAVQILQSLFGGVQITCDDAADVNDSGSREITDGIYGLRFLFQAGEPIPPPFSEPGFDPTEDELGCVGP